MTNIVWLIVRRMFGIILVAIAAAYVTASLAEWDIPWFDLPEQAHTPIVWGIYALITTWCLLPVLIDVPSKERVNLTPEKKPEGGLKAMLSSAVAAEYGATTYSAPWESPVGSGNWYVQGSDGSMYSFDQQLKDWVAVQR